jgi:hypothetical protein
MARRNAQYDVMTTVDRVRALAFFTSVGLFFLQADKTSRFEVLRRDRSIDLGSHPGNFQIAGTGSFVNGNGTSDIIWHSSS